MHHQRSQGDDDDEPIEILYEIQKIINKRVKNGNISYQVKWKGYTGKDSKTWEPIANLSHVPEMIYQFQQTLKSDHKRTKDYKQHEYKNKYIKKGEKIKEHRKVLKIYPQSHQNHSLEKQGSKDSLQMELQQINQNFNNIIDIATPLTQHQNPTIQKQKQPMTIGPDNKRIKYTKQYGIQPQRLRLLQQRESNIYIDEIKGIQDIQKRKDNKWYVLVSFRSQKYHNKWQDRNIIRLLYPNVLLEFYQKLIKNKNRTH